MWLVSVCMLLLRNSFSRAASRWSFYEYHYLSHFRGGRHLRPSQTTLIAAYTPKFGSDVDADVAADLYDI